MRVCLYVHDQKIRRKTAKSNVSSINEMLTLRVWLFELGKYWGTHKNRHFAIVSIILFLPPCSPIVDLLFCVWVTMFVKYWDYKADLICCYLALKADTQKRRGKAIVWLENMVPVAWMFNSLTIELKYMNWQIQEVYVFQAENQ